ncbi:hypothetical protein SANTM175S_02795 [Streptomyces antimycoticus]
MIPPAAGSRTCSARRQRSSLWGDVRQWEPALRPPGPAPLVPGPAAGPDPAKSPMPWAAGSGSWAEGGGTAEAGRPGVGSGAEGADGNDRPPPWEPDMPGSSAWLRCQDDSMVSKIGVLPSLKPAGGSGSFGRPPG